MNSQKHLPAMVKIRANIFYKYSINNPNVAHGFNKF